MNTIEYINKLKAVKNNQVQPHKLVSKAMGGQEFIVKELTTSDLEEIGIDSIRMDIYAENRDVCEQIALKAICEPDFNNIEAFGVETPVEALRLQELLVGPIAYHVFLTEVLGVALRFR